MAAASVFRLGSPAENGYGRSWLPRIGTTGASDTMTRRLRMTLWTLGRAVQRAHKTIAGWAEELVAAEQDGGLAAVSKLLRAKSIELNDAVGNLITATEAELIEDLPDRGQ